MDVLPERDNQGSWPDGLRGPQTSNPSLPAPGQGHQDFGVQALGSTAGRVQAGQVNQLLTLSEQLLLISVQPGPQQPLLLVSGPGFTQSSSARLCPFTLLSDTGHSWSASPGPSWPLPLLSFCQATATAMPTGECHTSPSPWAPEPSHPKALALSGLSRSASAAGLHF